VAVLVAAGAAGAAGSGDLPRGEVVEKLAPAKDPDQTYALYLPQGHDPGKPSAIAYLLDPRGRALVAIDVFRQAAEATGVVLASSYRSRSDEPTDSNTPALIAMLTDTHERLRIDDRRIYVAGFSGTARMACALANHAPDLVAGVVAAGAGFPSDSPPRTGMSFLYFGAVGDADFNYREVQALDRTLHELDAPYRIEAFEGGHAWMPPEVATAALRFMELSQVRSGRRPPSPELASAAWERDAARAEALEAARRPFEARRQWTAMARDYEGLHEVEEARSRAAALRKAAEKDEDDRRARDNREEHETGEALRTLVRVLEDRDTLVPVGSVVAEMRIDGLRRRAAADDDEGRSARRALNGIFVQAAFYLPREARIRSDHRQLALLLSVAAAIRPDDPQVLYRLAAAHALGGHRREAIESLEAAVTAGFADARRLAKDEDFARVREEAGFKELLSRLASGEISEPPP
jgi:dienelactone hydrolase